MAAPIANQSSPEICQISRKLPNINRCYIVNSKRKVRSIKWIYFHVPAIARSSVSRPKTHSVLSALPVAGYSLTQSGAGGAGQKYWTELYIKYGHQVLDVEICLVIIKCYRQLLIVFLFNLVEYNDKTSYLIWRKKLFIATYLLKCLENNKNTTKKAPSLEKNLLPNLPLWPQISPCVRGNLLLLKNFRLAGLDYDEMCKMIEFVGMLLHIGASSKLTISFTVEKLLNVIYLDVRLKPPRNRIWNTTW